MKIKLTPAQIEIAAKHQLHGTIDNNHLICDDPDQLITQLTPIIADILTWEYDASKAREIFATRYLYDKIRKAIDNQPEPQIATPIEIGSTVYVIGDRQSTYRVMGFNTDGSVLVYGGESINHRMYRDFIATTLTTIRP